MQTITTIDLDIAVIVQGFLKFVSANNNCPTCYFACSGTSIFDIEHFRNYTMTVQS